MIKNKGRWSSAKKPSEIMGICLMGHTPNCLSNFVRNCLKDLMQFFARKAEGRCAATALHRVMAILSGVRWRAGAGGAGAGDMAGRPGPLKIKPADTSLAIEYFTDEIESGNDSRCHGRSVHFIKRNSARRHFREVPSPICRHRQRKVCEDVCHQSTMSTRQSIYREVVQACRQRTFWRMERFFVQHRVQVITECLGNAIGDSLTSQ